MKKYILIIFLLCLSQAFAINFTNQLTKLELSVIGVDYPNDKASKRIERIEKIVYGNTKKGDINIRISKLNKDLNMDIDLEDKRLSEEKYNTANPEEIEDDSVDYPVIDEFEKHLAIKPKSKSLTQRLNTIEQNLYKKNFPNDDFYTRVERIKKKIPIHNNEDSIDEDIIGENKYIQTPFSKSNTDTEKIYRLTAIEKKVLHNTYQNENTEKRLTRLENRLFETDFNEDSPNERIARLESALNAKRSIKQYDSNKFQQRLNTALQIGAMVLMVLAFIL